LRGVDFLRVVYSDPRDEPVAGNELVNEFVHFGIAKRLH
jgi:hypothetical protein